MQQLSGARIKIADIDHSLICKAQKRLDSLTKPQGSLGKLEELDIPWVAKKIVKI